MKERRGRAPGPLDLDLRLSKNAAHRDGRRSDDRDLRDQRQENQVGGSGVGAALELVSETVDQEIDINQLHNALVALLVSYHRKRPAERGMA